MKPPDIGSPTTNPLAIAFPQKHSLHTPAEMKRCHKHQATIHVRIPMQARCTPTAPIVASSFRVKVFFGSPSIRHGSLAAASALFRNQNSIAFIAILLLLTFVGMRQLALSNHITSVPLATSLACLIHISIQLQRRVTDSRYLTIFLSIQGAPVIPYHISTHFLGGCGWFSCRSSYFTVTVVV